MKHYKERRHCWVLVDEDTGEVLCDTDGQLYRWKFKRWARLFLMKWERPIPTLTVRKAQIKVELL